MTAAQWKAAGDHRDKVWAEDRWAALVRNCQAARDKYLHAAKAARGVTSGAGWTVLDRPHAELEAFARNAWDLGFHGIPWPKGWKVRWADLTGLHALGLCVISAQLLLLDERAQHGRSPQEFLRTVLHELVHIQHPDENHGAGFEETLKRVLAFVTEPPEAVAPERPRRPEPVRGRMFDGRPVSWAGAGEWEFR